MPLRISLRIKFSPLTSVEFCLQGSELQMWPRYRSASVESVGCRTVVRTRDSHRAIPQSHRQYLQHISLRQAAQGPVSSLRRPPKRSESWRPTVLPTAEWPTSSEESRVS